MNIDGVNASMRSVDGSDPAEAEVAEAGSVGRDRPPAVRQAGEGWGRAGAYELDIEGIAQLYVTQLGEEMKTARTIADIRKKLLKMHGEKIVSAMKDHADNVRMSAMYQGTMTMVSSGLSIATSAASMGAGTGGGEAGGGTQGAAASAVSSGSSGVVSCLKQADPYKLEAEDNLIDKQEHETRQQQEAAHKKTSDDYLDSVRSMRSRVMQMLERFQQIREEGRQIAASPLRG